VPNAESGVVVDEPNVRVSVLDANGCGAAGAGAATPIPNGDGCPSPPPSCDVVPNATLPNTGCEGTVLGAAVVAVAAAGAAGRPKMGCERKPPAIGGCPVGYCTGTAGGTAATGPKGDAAVVETGCCAEPRPNALNA